MQCSEKHKKVNEQGIGLCSVPMWCQGVPAGFCDNEAYGERLKSKSFRDNIGRLRRVDGRYSGYIPFLACPGHGGPKIRVFMDGDQFCAVKPDFINLQESPAGFGNTREEAIKELQNDQAKLRPNILK